MKKQSHVNRRSFVKGAAGTATAIAAMSNVFPQSVLGANDRVIMGIIGPGGRGRGVMRDFLRNNCKFVGVADAYSVNLERGLEIAGEGAKGYKDYRKLLEDNSIDAVLIATPEHQHGVQLIDSVRAGKDAYCEKPMSHSIEEGARMVEEVRKTGHIVQIGMQRRSSPAVHEAKKVVDEGKLGNVYMVKAKWNWNWSEPLNYPPLEGELDWESFCFPNKPSEYRVEKFRNWRVFWEFSGGHVCDQGTHLMDVIQWFMNSGTPNMAECFGKVYKMTGAETPDVFSAIYQYDNFNASWELCYTSRYENGWQIKFLGDGGNLVLDGRGSRFYEDNPDEGRSDWDWDRKPDWEYKGPLPTMPHVENFLECLKSRKEPNAPVEVGHTAVCGPHLANVAWHNEVRAYLNPKATEVKVG